MYEVSLRKIYVLRGARTVWREVTPCAQRTGNTALGGLDQIACFRSLIRTGARRNPASCGTNQGNKKRRFARRLDTRPARIFLLFFLP